MKKIILIFTTILFVQCANQQQKNDLQKYNLNGKVKSCTQWRYKAVEKNGKIEKGDKIYAKRVNYQTLFNERGNELERVIYLSDKKEYKYIMKYDESECLIEIDVYSSEKLVGKVIFEYDENKNNIEMKEYNANGKLQSKYTFEYSPNGNKIKENGYGVDGSYIGHKKKFKYNNEKLIEESTYYKGDLVQKTVYEYKKGYKLGNTKKYEKDGSFMPTLAESVVAKYDKNDNVTEKRIYYSENVLAYLVIYKYEYDKQKNWIKSTKYIDNIPYEIIERNIEYYE